ncbi:MAG: hypothetical protein AABZ44_08050 [Elusimicrobiota bacterium]
MTPLSKLRPLACSALLLAIGTAGIRAQDIVLQFNPVEPAHWQRYLVLERLSSLFPDTTLAVRPVSPGKEKIKGYQDAQMGILRAHAYVYKHHPQNYPAFTRILSLSPMRLDWRQAASVAGIDTETLEKSIAADAGAAIEKLDNLDGDDAKITIDGKPIELGWDILEAASMINDAMPLDKRITTIKKIAAQPKPKMRITVISAQDIVSWASIEERVYDSLKNLPYESDVKRLTANSPQGKAMLKDAGFPMAPTVIFTPLDKAAKDELDDYASRGAMLQAGPKKDLYIAREFSSSGVLWQRQESAQKELRLFIMSECPFGTIAQQALLNAKQANKLPADVRLTYHYIVDDLKQGTGKDRFRSLHGSGELEENVRQSVMQKFYPDKLDCYVSKRIGDIRSTLWNQALQECGVDFNAFQKLYNEHGDDLMAEDAALSRDLGISSSPTFLWKDRYVLAGLTNLQKVEGFSAIETQAQPGKSAAGSCAQ